MDSLELAFVLAPRQNLFFVELVAALRAEAEKLGAKASVHTGNFPPPTEDIVYVLVPPHEYFTLARGERRPSRATLLRTIFICAEQPDTGHFKYNVELARSAGAVFDINRSAVRAFAEHGVDVQHFQLGWTEEWDHLDGRERDIDVLFMGCTSRRREEALGRLAPTLHRRRHRLVISDNSRPNWMPSESFRTDEEKWDLLARTKVMLNVHQGDRPYFEWLRIVQAIINGAVVVSEHSLDFSPLVPGRHFLVGDAASLGMLAELLLEDDERRWRMQTEAYRFVRDKLPLRGSVEALIAAAGDLVATEPSPPANDPFFAQPPPNPDTLPLFASPDTPLGSSTEDPATALLLRATKQQRLETLGLARRLSRIEVRLSRGREVPRVELVSQSRAYAASAPRVSVLTALYNHASEVSSALGSLLRSRELAWELIVVDDGSTDGGDQVVERWIRTHENLAALLLRHPVNQGLGPARNSALGFARGEYYLVLDADNELYPECLTRLIEVLDEDPAATFAYGILERFGSRVPGLWNFHPWDPARFRISNYIDALALIRAAAVRDLGGYTSDPRLYGWEDFDLWCRIAESGGHGTLLPEIVARYRATEHSMLSITNISLNEAFSLLIERNPCLMAGLKPPL